MSNAQDGLITNGLSTPLASEHSTQVSLASLREKQAGLNQHRQSILNRVPDQNSWGQFKSGYISFEDIAYLSAATDDEFALLTGKNEDVLFHGTHGNCHIEQSDVLMESLKTHKLELTIHSHPDRDRIVASSDDRKFIASIGQKTSKIISSYTGQIIEFNANMFDDI